MLLEGLQVPFLTGGGGGGGEGRGYIGVTSYLFDTLHEGHSDSLVTVQGDHTSGGLRGGLHQGVDSLGTHTTTLKDKQNMHIIIISFFTNFGYQGELGYDRLNGTRKISPSYAKSVVYIWQILDMLRTGTKHIVHHMQKSVVQWSVISKFTCISDFRRKYYLNIKYNGTSDGNNDYEIAKSKDTKESTYIVPKSLAYSRQICKWQGATVYINT